MTKLLKPMTDADFQQYREYAVKNYADEHVKAGNWQDDEAPRLADEQFHSLLPDGVHTKQHHLFKLHDEKEGDVGILWLNITLQDAFIYDIEVEEVHRGKGFGKGAIQAVDSFCRANNVKQVRLHVFAHNQHAISLYEQMGYKMTDHMMAKRLSESMD
ncbi:GNAT family N-acetyltransferase [Thalassobacillus sp. CUG 92003]|uniref:GNAT family N-acetyltransferase n=1 Tax=Thalassobacillus sp. CUG 92003 TaxID=2736641 RepID=UPI0015E6BE38|nr:GNAT family N-acetyltransferase [Thalassobacillus sp. CUG 92003]